MQLFQKKKKCIKQVLTLFWWQFASLIIFYLGYSDFETMLYTSPAGAVQIIFVWIGITLCYLWPNRRCAITIGLTIVPLTGIILLFALPLSAGWGMIVASWLVCTNCAVGFPRLDLAKFLFLIGLCYLQHLLYSA